MNYNRYFFMEMIRDWQANNAPEYDDLEINEPEFKNGEWTVIVKDDKNVYSLTDNSGNIIINYLGSR